MSFSSPAHTGAGRNGKKASQEEGRASAEDSQLGHPESAALGTWLEFEF